MVDRMVAKLVDERGAMTTASPKHNPRNLRRALFAPALLLLALLVAGCANLPTLSDLTGAASAAPMGQANAQTPTQPSVGNATNNVTDTAANTSTNMASLAPSIAVDPPAGYGGIYVRVTGEGWPRNMMVVVALEDGESTSHTLAAMDTDMEGTLSTGFLYPIDARWLDDAAYQVVATTADGQHSAVINFRVAQPGTAPEALASLPTPRPTPTAVPTIQPTAAPVAQPTVAPTVVPTAIPTVEPTVPPTPVPQTAEVRIDNDDAAPADSPPAALSAEQIDPESIVAGFLPINVKRNKGEWVIQAGTVGPLDAAHTLVAVIETPRLADYDDDDFDLDRDDDW
ncbi:MAG: hypothetical protein WDZ49_02100, partial [Litorilinea sp.]